MSQESQSVDTPSGEPANPGPDFIPPDGLSPRREEPTGILVRTTPLESQRPQSPRPSALQQPYASLSPPSQAQSTAPGLLIGVTAGLIVLVIVLGLVIWSLTRQIQIQETTPPPNASDPSLTQGPTAPQPTPPPTHLPSPSPANLPAPAGTLLVAGDNSVGQRGLGFTSGSDFALVTAVPQLSGVTSVFVDWSGLVYAITGDGELWAWGSNEYGLIGDGTTTDSYAPVKVPIEGHVTAAYPCGIKSWAVTKEGSVWVWGHNYGPTPTLFDGLPLMTAISGGMMGVYGLARDGTVWGLDHVEGIFGYDITMPYQIPGLSSIVSLSAGDASNLALDDQGVVWAWGQNRYGNVGDGTKEPRSSPVIVPGLPAVSSIAIGESSSYALGVDGTVWCWGFNLFGMCGTGATPGNQEEEGAMYMSPVQVQGIPAIDRFMAYTQTAVAFSGTDIYVWGNGEFMTYLHDWDPVVWFNGVPSPAEMYGFDGVTTVFGASGSIFAIAG